MTKNQTEDLFSADLFGEENQEQDIQVEPDTKALENETSASVAQTVEAEAESTQESSVQEEQAEEARLETEEIAETEPEAQTPAPIPIEARPVLSGDDGEQLTLAHFASHAYLEYAMSVVKGRALPAIGDGQKPVQRRIL